MVDKTMIYELEQEYIYMYNILCPKIVLEMLVS